jgi:hypothetical protein
MPLAYTELLNTETITTGFIQPDVSAQRII